MTEPHSRPGFRNSRIALVSAALFAVLSFYKTFQHLTFNTYAYDLGIRASILFNIAFKGRVWDSLHGLHGFSGHFHPVSFLLAGLYRLWPSALHLCILQALAVSLGFFFFLKLLQRKIPDTRIHFPLALIFLLNPFVHHVLTFDFHPEIFALPLVLAFFLLVEDRRYGLSAIPAFALLTLKEDMGLLVFSLGIYLLIHRKWLLGAVMSVIGLVWLPGVLLIILPLFRTPGSTELISLHYASLGSTASGIITTILERPWIILTNIFTSPRKLLTIAFLAASFGSIVTVRWESLLILPLLFAHMLSDGPNQSSLLLQYSAGITPLLLYSFSQALPRLKSSKAWVPWLLVAIALPAVICIFPNPFKNGVDLKRVAEIHRTIRAIPPHASVSAGNDLAPHLINRENIRLYPDVSDSRFVVVNLEGNIFPAVWKERYSTFSESTAGYRKLAESYGLYLVEKD